LVTESSMSPFSLFFQSLFLAMTSYGFGYYLGSQAPFDFIMFGIGLFLYIFLFTYYGIRYIFHKWTTIAGPKA
jgi:ABC-type multidrug transport system permease subunit